MYILKRSHVAKHTCGGRGEKLFGLEGYAGSPLLPLREGLGCHFFRFFTKTLPCSKACMERQGRKRLGLEGYAGSPLLPLREGLGCHFFRFFTKTLPCSKACMERQGRKRLGLEGYAGSPLHPLREGLGCHFFRFFTVIDHRTKVRWLCICRLRRLGGTG